ncbi:hypothetical protein O1Q96_00645 (plasmid) [Streptomyces sp. Qhu-G9]|uniref:hypothetical protein n=1 Tax=Streptomyces sp. Qhu-G9 TaxID=3452799 RepID=UPI0022ABCE38|nr:hypothetical protein [Streptomyces aurantiacus]WAU78388.1 hypothetical protein O1Q96_00645 [Streptomyces aurantiacus]
MALTVMGGMTAAAATPPDDAGLSGTSPSTLQKEREAALNGARVVANRANAEKRKTCEEVQHEAAADGKKQAMCVEIVDAATARKRLNSTSADSADSAVWCDENEAGKVYVTRVSICENQVLQVMLLNTETGAPLGIAFLTVKQEVNTREVDGKPLPLAGSFHEDFYMQVQGASGALAAGFNVEIDSDCAPTSQCQQGEDPWTGPVPVTVLSELEGTWNRVWKEPVGNATMLLGYKVTVSQGGHKASHSWGVNESAAWQVRCDKQIGTAIGCIVPAFLPTFVVDYLKYPGGSDYIHNAQLYIKTQPGRWRDNDKGVPLRREADDATATKNRNKVCDSTFKVEDWFDGKYQIQCDEYPFARTKESGAQLGIASGSECKQFMLVPGYPDQEPKKNHIQGSYRPNGPANCARASMIKADNEGIGGDLGRFYVQNRMLDNDAFWVDAMSWRDYCGC